VNISGVFSISETQEQNINIYSLNFPWSLKCNIILVSWQHIWGARWWKKFGCELYASTQQCEVAEPDKLLFSISMVISAVWTDCWIIPIFYEYNETNHIALNSQCPVHFSSGNRLTAYKFLQQHVKWSRPWHCITSCIYLKSVLVNNMLMWLCIDMWSNISMDVVKVFFGWD
jgi:hypothetical protein